MKCWICEIGEADSREHLIKASDLRLLYPGISAISPAYMHTRDRKNIAIHSAKSNRLKTDNPVICRRCNDTATAPHDNAWSELLRHIQAKKRKAISLKNVFPGNSGRKARYLHLYFVKLFGCRIVDEHIPINVSRFAEAIRNDLPLDYFYLTLNYRSSKDWAVGVTGIHGDTSLEMATWYYMLGRLDVQLIWFNNQPENNVPKAWSPSERGKVLTFRRR